MSGLKKYNKKGKRFNTKPSSLATSVNDVLLSYEQIEVLHTDSKASQCYHNFDKSKGEVFIYVPKKTRNKKDIVARHRRSTKKTNRQESKQEINKEL